VPAKASSTCIGRTATFDSPLVSQRKLNAPWGMVQATANFGDFSNDLLVGNFGDGRINVYDPTSGKFLGTLKTDGHPITIGGLWSWHLEMVVRPAAPTRFTMRVADHLFGGPATFGSSKGLHDLANARTASFLPSGVREQVS
jgi:hypothetical protein